MCFQLKEIGGTSFIFLKSPKCKKYNVDKSENCKCCGKKLTIVFKEKQELSSK